MSEQHARRAQRDRGLARAKELRTWCAFGAAVATAVLALFAASSIPGRATGSSATGPGSGVGVASQSGLQPLQPPDQGGLGGQNGSAPIVVSGGS
ncbi:MAG: hypothetical protein WB808_05455 [Candidatus Dormiibacterota bacterium]